MESKDEKQCKICLETDGNDLIAPCYCSGSSKWIHRSCLDTWRSTHAGRAFTHCGLCGFEYVIELADDSHEEQCRRIRWKMYVARDTLAVFLVVQAVIIILGFMVRALDVDGVARDAFPQPLSDHEKTSYYIWGFIVFLAAIGLVGTVLKCIDHPLFAQHRPIHPYARGAPNVHGGGGNDIQGGDPPADDLGVGLVRQHTPRRYRNNRDCCGGRGSVCSGNDCQGCYCNCPAPHGGGSADCCRGCGSCNCNGDLKEGVIIILIIALVILVFVGVFVVIFLGSLLVQRIMQRHMRILWLREETKKYVVVDFANQPLPPRDGMRWDEEMGGSGSVRYEHNHSHNDDADNNSDSSKPIDSKKRLYQSQHPESDDGDVDDAGDVEAIDLSTRKPSKSESRSRDIAPSAPDQQDIGPRPQIIRSMSGGAPGGPRTKTFPDELFD